MTPLPRLVLCVALAATASTTLLAQDGTSHFKLARAILKESSENSQVMQFQDELCHNYGGRLTGSLAYNRAADWAVEQFREMGLEARLDQWGEWKVGWDREQWMGRMVSPSQLELQVATPAWTGGTRGIARGTLVIMPRGQAECDVLAQRASEGEQLWIYGAVPRGEKGDPVRGLLDHKNVHGIVQSATSTGWNSKSYKNQIRVFGNRNGGLVPYESRQQWAQAVVRDDQSKQIEQAMAGKDPVVIEFELRNRYRRGPVALNNVIADIVGSEFPNEYVIICAHLDSWHQATGATDNGTGSCSTLEAARLLSSIGFKPRRTVRFMLWSGEEQGLLGSRGFVVKNRLSMHKVSAVFNHDSGTNWAHQLTVAESHADVFRTAIAPILELMKPPQKDHVGDIFKINARKILKPAGGGSDHASFGAVGIPAFSWRLKGHVPYGRGWHSQWDTYSIVEPEFQRHNAAVFAIIAANIANQDKILSRVGVDRAKPGRRGRVNAQLVLETWLGIEIDESSIKTIAAGSMAAKAKLMTGDRIISIDGTEVKTTQEMLAAMREAASENEEVAVTVMRNDQKVVLKLRP